MKQPVCPKCQYQRQAYDSHVMEGICPACGIAYAKWRPETDQTTSPQNLPEAERDDIYEDDDDDIAPENIRTRLVDAVTYVPDRVDSVAFWGRAILFVALFIWGWSFILAGISVEKLMGSFMHSIILPFHEFGHVLFSPFGRFMTILGGSLFQVLLPLGLAAAFVYQMNDNFGASVMLWWAGQSFMDVSVYIADASFRTLPLIAGMGEESHDWGNLLSMLDMLNYDWTIACFSFGIGVVLMVLSWLWGGYILYLQKQVLNDF